MYLITEDSLSKHKWMKNVKCIHIIKCTACAL